MPTDIETLKELYDLLPQAVIWMRPVHAPGGSIVGFTYDYANPAALAYFDLPAKGIEGLKLSNTPTIKDALRPAMLDELAGVITQGAPVNNEIYNAALGKHARFYRMPLRGGVLTVAQDYSNERRIIRELEAKTPELEEQRTLLDNILQNSSNGISVSEIFRDEAGKVIDALTVLANNAAVQYIGLPRDVYLSKRATEIEPGIIGSAYYEACIRTLDTGEAFVMQYQMESTKRWLELTVSRLDGNHLIQIFTDVTPIKEAQLRLESTVKALERSNGLLEDFAHAASHDMKEPLRKILTFADRLKTSLGARLQDGDLDLFGRLEKAVRQLQTLVDELLEFSQVGRGDMKAEVRLDAVVEAAWAGLELEAEETGAALQAVPLPVVTGNPRQLQQLFHNIFDNTLKYRRAGAAPRISIEGRIIEGKDAPVALAKPDSDAFLHLSVTDNGIGFEQRYAERIFGMFQRLHARAEYAGTGIGLALARKVAESHGGAIWAEGRPGEGATFHILLPLAGATGASAAASGE